MFIGEFQATEAYSSFITTWMMQRNKEFAEEEEKLLIPSRNNDFMGKESNYLLITN
jgi:hypothetical protein